MLLVGLLLAQGVRCASTLFWVKLKLKAPSFWIVTWSFYFIRYCIIQWKGDWVKGFENWAVGYISNQNLVGTSVLCSGSNFFLDELVHCCQLPVLRHLVATRLAAQPKLQQGSNKENHVRLKQPSRCASNRTIIQPGSFSPFARLWTLVRSAFAGRVNAASHEPSTSNAELVYRSSTVHNFKETATASS